MTEPYLYYIHCSIFKTSSFLYYIHCSIFKTSSFYLIGFDFSSLFGSFKCQAWKVTIIIRNIQKPTRHYTKCHPETREIRVLLWQRRFLSWISLLDNIFILSFLYYLLGLECTAYFFFSNPSSTQTFQFPQL